MAKQDLAIRPAMKGEYDEIGRIWMESWVSTGLDTASDVLLANLRARIPQEVEKGWSLFVPDDGGSIAAMLALHLPKLYLDRLSSPRNIRDVHSAGGYWLSRERKCRTKYGCAASAKTKRPGADTRARALCLNAKRRSRRSDA